MSTEGTGPDIGVLLSQMSQVRDAVHSAQQSAAAQIVRGRAGGGMVQVEVTGGLDFRSVTIDPSVVEPGEAEMLADLVLAAVRDAVEQVNGLQAQALGGLDPGSLPGLGGS